MSNRILAALDTTSTEDAVRLCKKLDGLIGGVKLGLEFVTANGPDSVRAIVDTGQPLFLDLKFHDIPNTVAGAIRAVVPLRPAIVNVHASGGPAMMKAAREAAEEAAGDAGVPVPLVIAVTVLTSLDDADLAAVGQRNPAEAQAVRLARLAESANLGGVVCSPKEILAIRKACDPSFKLVVPGIRPLWSATGDQKRFSSPAAALKDGADYLVIGRPITAAPDPADAAQRITEEIPDT
jgi:orotidine-5'-phosphate decarboxylase